jgi:hypothetical protein
MNVFFGGSLQLGEYFQKMKKKQKFCDLEKFFSPFFEIKIIKVVTSSH